MAVSKAHSSVMVSSGGDEKLGKKWEDSHGLESKGSILELTILEQAFIFVLHCKLPCSNRMWLQSMPVCCMFLEWLPSTHKFIERMSVRSAAVS